MIVQARSFTAYITCKGSLQKTDQNCTEAERFLCPFSPVDFRTPTFSYTVNFSVDFFASVDYQVSLTNPSQQYWRTENSCISIISLSLLAELALTIIGSLAENN